MRMSGGEAAASRPTRPAYTALLPPPRAPVVGAGTLVSGCLAGGGAAAGVPGAAVSGPFAAPSAGGATSLRPPTGSAGGTAAEQKEQMVGRQREHR